MDRNWPQAPRHTQAQPYCRPPHYEQADSVAQRGPHTTQQHPGMGAPNRTRGPPPERCLPPQHPGSGAPKQTRGPPLVSCLPPQHPGMMGGLPSQHPGMMGGLPSQHPGMMGGLPPQHPGMMGGLPPQHPGMVCQTASENPQMSPQMTTKKTRTVLGYLNPIGRVLSATDNLLFGDGQGNHPTRLGWLNPLGPMLFDPYDEILFGDEPAYSPPPKVTSAPPPVGGLPPQNPGTMGGLPLQHPGTMGGLPPQHPGTISCLPPQHPGTMGGLPPQHPGMMGGLPPQHPGTISCLPPQHPGMMGGLPPQHPGMMGGLPPQHPGMMGGLPPQHPGTISCLPPQHPGTGYGTAPENLPHAANSPQPTSTVLGWVNPVGRVLSATDNLLFGREDGTHPTVLGWMVPWGPPLDSVDNYFFGGGKEEPKPETSGRPKDVSDNRNIYDQPPTVGPQPTDEELWKDVQEYYRKLKEEGKLPDEYRIDDVEYVKRRDLPNRLAPGMTKAAPKAPKHTRGPPPAGCLPPQHPGTISCLPPQHPGTISCLPPQHPGMMGGLPPQHPGTISCLPPQHPGTGYGTAPENLPHVANSPQPTSTVLGWLSPLGRVLSATDNWLFGREDGTHPTVLGWINPFGPPLDSVDNYFFGEKKKEIIYETTGRRLDQDEHGNPIYPDPNAQGLVGQNGGPQASPPQSSPAMTRAAPANPQLMNEVTAILCKAKDDLDNAVNKYR